MSNGPRYEYAAQLEWNTNSKPTLRCVAFGLVADAHAQSFVIHLDVAHLPEVPGVNARAS